VTRRREETYEEPENKRVAKKNNRKENNFGNKDVDTDYS
jgi:ribosomal protein S21